MLDRKTFAERISHLSLSRCDQAIAFLWFYRLSQEYEERTASELAKDLADEGLGRPNVTELHKHLVKSRKTVKGRRPKTFQLHTKYLSELNDKYGPLVDLKKINITSFVIPANIVQGTRQYLERLVEQINGTYDQGFYDSSAVIARRLLESLIIDVFIHNKIANEIKDANGFFVALEQLIARIKACPTVHLSRAMPGAMDKIKRLGDTAAHDRTYITQVQDIDDMKLYIRKTIQELLSHAGIIPKA
jgi:hypothetical protein